MFVPKAKKNEKPQESPAAKEPGKKYAMKKSINLWAFPYPQRMNLRDQIAWSARDVIGAEEPDDGRDAGERIASQGHRRYPGPEAGFTTTAGDVHVAVDQAGHEFDEGVAQAAEVGRRVTPEALADVREVTDRA